MKTEPTFPLVPPDGEGDRRHRRDRLELLETLLAGPRVEPVFRAEVICVPPDHPVYRWQCLVNGCERPISGSAELCSEHCKQWNRVRLDGTSKARFRETAAPLAPSQLPEDSRCRICPDRPACSELGLCKRHYATWLRRRRQGAVLADWVVSQEPFPGYGCCRVLVCAALAASPLGLCDRHERRYHYDGRPGGAVLPPRWGQKRERRGLRVPVTYRSQPEFARWCARTPPVLRAGQLNLRGLPPLLRAELQWGLVAHTDGLRPTVWQLYWVQSLIDSCRADGLQSLAEVDTERCSHFSRMITLEMRNSLQLVYYTPADTRAAGFIETDHFGVRFTNSGGHFDLTQVSQRWLRDLLWDHLAERLRAPEPPRGRGVFDNLRRACVELSAFLEDETPSGGHHPPELGEDEMRRFVADQRHRARLGLASRGLHRSDGKPSTVSDVSRRMVFNHARQVLHGALASGEVERLGLDRRFVAAVPRGGRDHKRPRSPFPDDVARALASEDNLRRLERDHDPYDRGIRDIWETILVTGRRAGEAIALRWDCLGRINGLPMLWHDQTKTDKPGQAIRISEPLYERLRARQDTTVARFTDRHGQAPTGTERAAMALFPSNVRNPDGRYPISYGRFQQRFQAWITELDLGTCVAHQARHTLATNLLAQGATLAHVRKYLGQVSDRMAEHYTHIADSEVDELLQHVWVAGPGSAQPGTVLSTGIASMTRAEAHALAVDLGRLSTRTEGGLCTFQPVVNGGACPWNLDCHNCDKFVLSGADLLYWRRKREQWRSIAERAPDDATANYLHEVFEPTAAAIDGLEQALNGLGLLEDALALDLRRPQDYFQPLWNIAFRAADLEATDTTDHADPAPTASNPDENPSSCWIDGESA